MKENIVDALVQSVYVVATTIIVYETVRAVKAYHKFLDRIISK